MGIGSTPLFATVQPGNSEDYRINVSELSKDVIQKFEYMGFFHTGADSYTLSEFMDTQCDYHKLLYYMENDKVDVWLRLFTYLSEKYPDIEEIAFHFFCSDEKIPFYFIWKRHDSLKELIMHVGNSEDTHCCKENPNKIKPYHPSLIFDKELYMKKWRIISINKMILKKRDIF